MSALIVFLQDRWFFPLVSFLPRVVALSGAAWSLVRVKKAEPVVLLWLRMRGSPSRAAPGRWGAVAGGEPVGPQGIPGCQRPRQARVLREALRVPGGRRARGVWPAAVLPALRRAPAIRVVTWPPRRVTAPRSRSSRKGKGYIRASRFPDGCTSPRALSVGGSGCWMGSL